MKKVRVCLGERSYEIVIGPGLLQKSGRELRRLDIGSDAVIITNNRLKALYGKTLERSLKKSGFSTCFITVPDSEKAKSITVATSLINRLSAYDVGRKIFVIAFGGGVIGDLAGFVSAVYKRGIPYIQMPTTLLAQVDSSIGGKVAVDLPVAKNLVGAFYQPKIVLADTALIKSLPIRQVRAGLAEVIKYGVIRDARLFRFLENNYKQLLACKGRELESVVYACCRIKAGVVARDERDTKDARAILNFGHTLGHAIEAAAAYSGRYNHGEAIAVGMLIAARIAVDQAFLRGRDAERLESLVKKVGLPAVVKGVSLPGVYASHLHDKKFFGKTNRFILPSSIGNVRIVKNVPAFAIRNALKAYAA